MHRRILLLALLLSACGLPKPRPADEVLLDREFNAKFGVPGMVPIEPIKPRTALEVGAARLFGDPAEAPPVVKAPPEVPPIRVEPVPRKPRYGQYAWQPSAWEWNGHAFVWKLGAWVQPPPGAQWENGRWTTNEIGDYIWITGGWV